MRVRLILGTTIGACVAALVWSQVSVSGQSTKAPRRRTPRWRGRLRPAPPPGFLERAPRPRRRRRRRERDGAAPAPRSVLRHLSQRTPEDRESPAGPAGPRTPGRSRRGGREGDSPRARRPDAAERREASRPGGPRRSGHLDGALGGHVRARAPAGARPAPPESHRVRQRDPRPAVARGRCDPVPAAGRLHPRVRQHRRSPHDVPRVDGGVSLGGRQDQPARPRQCHRADAGRVRRAGRHRTEPSRRGPALRHPRRHAHLTRVPGRRSSTASP